MKNHAVLHSDDWDSLITIQRKLALRLPLTQQELDTLASFLGSVPPPEAFTFSEKDIPDTLDVTFVNDRGLQELTDKWVALFTRLPAVYINKDEPCVNSLYDTFTSQNFYVNKIGEIRSYINKNAFLIVDFYPSLHYKAMQVYFELIFKLDGSAVFHYSDEMNEQEAQDFPLFGTFQGSWKEAYLLLIQTLLAHWPKEKFPKEFQSLTFH